MKTDQMRLTQIWLMHRYRNDAAVANNRILAILKERYGNKAIVRRLVKLYDCFDNLDRARVHKEVTEAIKALGPVWHASREDARR